MRVFYCAEKDDLIVLDLRDRSPQKHIFINIFGTWDTELFKDSIIFISRDKPMVQYRYDLIGDFD